MNNSSPTWNAGTGKWDGLKDEGGGAKGGYDWSMPTASPGETKLPDILPPEIWKPEDDEDEKNAWK